MMKLWMYESWCEDQVEKNEFAKNYALFIGSFSNPELAQKYVREEKPTFQSSDEDFEESTRMMLRDRDKKIKMEEKPRRRRRRRQILTRE